MAASISAKKRSRRVNITNAVAIGKEVVVSDTAFASGRWSGVGYVITDPQTGAGAYLIEGGLDGGADNAGCAEEPAVEPASEPVDISRMSFAALSALAIIAILVAATVPAIAAQVAVVGVVLIVASSPVQAAVPPLEPGLQAIWDVTFGRALGAFPTGPFPGEGLTGYGTCDKATFKPLRAEQNSACRQKGSCEDGECDSEKIKQMIANQTACIEARINIMMTCFKGGDEAYWGEVRKRLVPIEHCQQCLSDTMAGQCTE